ncbi:AAA family ATPase [Dictyobacter arantiisoli]|uniref:ATPase n=1 Tax=Dictyobacter arantiisoli TaxID=2014874 RepID=A0A5A5TDF1_9CHLR|nr:MoxR family ATPase [Dictyobacter arantiisoli]GCF08884.1 ATPase [Dictyobacter arantiisoli]
MAHASDNTVNPYDDSQIDLHLPAYEYPQQTIQDQVTPVQKSATPTKAKTNTVPAQASVASPVQSTPDTTTEPGEEDVTQFIEVTQQLEQELCRIVVGQDRVIRELLLAMLAGGHALLEGVPGLGKTLLVRTLSDALALKFARIQFTPDLMPADIVGTNIVTEQNEVGTSGSKRGFSFQPGPIFANIVLADEINRATPKTQSALLEGMQERTVSVGDRTRPLPQPFFVLATQNPLEMEGTYTLPEAQLDRFLLKIMVTFPKAEDLMRIIDTTVGTQVLRAHEVTNGEQLAHMINVARAVPIATSVKEYAVRLLLATHPDQEDAPEKVRQYVRYGGSPRGLQALISTAKVRALLEGRYNVSREDIKAVAYPALRHRMVLNFDGLADNISTEHLIETIINELDAD